MDIESKNAWARRMRSGEVTQIFSSLYDECGGRCALGVLCEVLGIDMRTSVDSPYTELANRGIDNSFFWYANDVDRKSFIELADIVDALPIDAPVFTGKKRVDVDINWLSADR